MNLNVNEEKTKQMVEKYNSDPTKGDMTRKQYAIKLSHDPKFVSWLFDFEQNEERSDLSTGMSKPIYDAFSNWIDIYDNY